MRPFFTKTTITLLTAVVLLAATTTALAQTSKQANNWLFGANAGVSFNTGAPVTFNTSAMNVFEGSASMSDGAGALLFYTNGQTVWTRNNVAMPNGSGLLGDPSATQSAIIVPNPTSASKYWVFTVDKDGGANGLRYSEVDMTLNGGNGDVTASKNIALATPVSEKITAIKKCDGSGYYILAHRFNSNQFLLYQTTTTTPTPTLVSQQTIGMTHSNSSASNAAGYMKASASGKKIALATNTLQTVELYDFNNSTGVLSNLKTINVNKWCYGVEFSPNMKYLYVSVWYDNGGNRVIQQYDISGATPNNTYNHNTPQTVGALQLATDGKIYYTIGDYNGATGRMNANNGNLGAITAPNNNGGTAGWNNAAVNLNGRTCDYGLPNFIQSYVIDNSKDFTFTNLCYGSNTDFTSTLPSDADSVRFFFGDGFESYVRNPSHLYGGTGTYTVKMKIFKGCIADSISKTLTIISCASSACNSGTGCFSPNLITNGGFESGNTGFTSNFNPNNGNASCTVGANSCGQFLCGNGYALATSPTPCNPTWSNSIRDHTSGAGNMMLVDFPNSGQNNIWCQTVNLTAGTDYCFGAYYINLLPAGTGQPTPTFIYTVGGVASGNSATIPENEQWNFTGINFNAGAGGAVQLCIKNQNAGGVGYDVAIDDVTLRSTLAGTPPTATQDVIGLCGVAATGSVNVLTNDVSGSALMNNASLRIIQQAPFSQGVATANTATGVISFTASAGFSGPVAVQYQICNTAGCCDNGTILIDRLPSSVPSVAITQDNPFPICPGGLVTFTATPTNGGTTPTYQWNVGGVDVPGEINPTFLTNTLTNGQVVKVTMTSNEPCAVPLVATAQVTAVVAPMPVPTITGVTTLCEGAVWDLTAVSPTAVLFEWSNGATGNQYQSAPVAPGETITVTVTNAGGCTATATKTVVVTAPPVVTVTGNPGFWCADPTSSFTLTASGGTSYHWQGGPFAAAYTVSPTTTTTYTVTATSNGCSATAEEVVIVSSVGLIPMPNQSVCANQVVTFGQTNNSNNYIWVSSGVPINATTGLISTAPIATTTYTVTATDPNTGCTETGSITITVGNIPPTITGNATICAGSSTTLTCSSSQSYAWSVAGNTGASIIVSPAITTTYTVTATAVGGCTGSKTIQVVVNPLPIAAISAPASICTGGSGTLTASGATSYVWNNAFNTASITVSPSAATTYTVTATDANGCTDTESAAITIGTLAMANMPPVTICSGLSTTIGYVDATKTYVWSSGQTTGQITVSPTASTTYTVTVTEIATGCIVSKTVIVTVNQTPTVSIAGGTATICAGSPVTLTASTPTAGVTYNWGGANTNAALTINPLVPTTYTVTVTVTTGGCTGTASKAVNVTPLPTASIAPVAPFCAGSGTTLTASGGGFYAWSNAAITTATNTVNPLATTTYTVTVTQNSCPSTASITVTPNSLTLTPMPAQSICPGATATIGYTGLPATYTYNWANGLGSTAQITVTPSVPTNYTVTVTDNNNCTNVQSVAVTVGSLPTPTITGNPASLEICAGGSITLTSSNAVSYLWNTGPTTQGITVTPSTTTTYTITVTAAGGCTATNSVIVTFNQLPIAGISGTNSFCAGGNTTLTASVAAPNVATSYLWSNTPASITAAINVAPSAPTTTYTVTITDNKGCTDTESRVVTVNPLPVASIVGNTTICLNGSTTLTAAGGNTFVWSTTPTSALATITVAPTTPSTIYTVTTTDANGCTDTESATVIVNFLPTVTINGPSTVCQGSSITLTAFSASAGATYDWGITLGATLTDSPAAPTAYNVTVTDGNGCTNTATKPITITPLPTANITGNTSFCVGTGGVTLTATGGTTYAWSNGTNGASNTVNPNTVTTYTVTATQNNCTSVSSTIVTPNSFTLNPMTSATICQGLSATIGDPAIAGVTYSWANGLGTNAQFSVTPASTTTYTVTATDANGCTDSETVMVTVNPLPVVPVIPNQAICLNASATLTASGGGTYAWDNTANTGTIIVTPTAPSTTYTVTVTNAATCSTTRNVTVTVNPLPMVNIAGGTTVCAGTTVNLTASGAATYIWNGSVAGAAFTSTPAANTTYTVVGTDFNGCKGSSSVAIVVNSLTQPNMVPLTTCANAPITIGYPNDPALTYAWSGGLVPLPNISDPSVTIPATTTYTVTITDSNGCTIAKSVTVNVNNNLQVNITGPTSVCNGANVTLTASSPSAGATFDWNGTPGAPFTALPALGPNTYTVLATGTTGCTGTASYSVTANPLPIASITTATGNTAICLGTNAVLTGAGGNTYAWSTIQNTTSITVSPVAQTTYTVTATDGNGCTDSETVTINVNQLTMPPLTNVTICKGTGQSVGYTDNTVTYNWGSALGTNGQITPTPLVQTTYTVTVTDINLCSTTSSVTVSLHPDAVATIQPVADICRGTNTTLTANGGVGYDWGNGNILQTFQVAPTTNTPYTVRVTDLNGCTATTSITVVVNQLPTITISGLATACANATVTLTGNGGVSYSWNSGVATPTNDVVPTLAANPNTYTVTGTDANNCTATATHVITAVASPAPGVLVTANQVSPVCSGTAITFTATLVPANSGGANPSYAWSIVDNTTGVSSPAGNNSPSFVVSNLQGDVSVGVVVTSSNACPTGSGSDAIPFIITPSVTPSVTLAVSANPICAGNPVTFTATPTNEGAAPIYEWLVNGVVQAGQTAATFSPATIANNDVVLVNLTSNAVCATPTTAGSSPITMTVNPVLTPTITVGSAQASICQGATANFTAVFANAGTNPTFQWQVNGANVGTNTATYSSVTLVSTDVVTCIITPSGTCNAGPATSNPVSVTVNPNVSPLVTLSQPAAVCPGTPITLTATPTNQGTNPVYNWFVNGNPVSNTGTTYSPTNLANGDVIRVELVSDVACAISNPASSNLVTISILQAVTPTIRIFTTNPTVCAGSTADFTSFITNGGTNPTYQWFINGNLQAATTPTFSVTTLLTGDVVTCSLTSDAVCAVNPANSNPIAVNVLPQVTPQVNIVNIPTVCSGALTAFYANPVSGGGTVPNFIWYVNGVQAGTGNPYRTNAIIPGDVLTVEMAGNQQCAVGTATSPPYTPNVQVLTPTLTTMAIDTCLLNKGKVFVNTVPNLPVLVYAYVWSDASVSRTDTLFNVSSTQTYTVTISDNLGCSVTASVAVPTIGKVTITGMTTAPQECINPLTSGLAAVVHDRTNSPYTYKWFDINDVEVSTDSIARLPAGDYTVSVTDISGCVATRMATIQPPIYPLVSINPRETTLILGDSIRLTALPVAQEAYIYAWSPVAGLNCYDCKKPMAKPVVSSVYTVTITNAAGCTATASANVLIDNQYNIYIPNIITPNNDGQNDAFIIYANSSAKVIRKMTIFDRWGELVYTNQNIPPNSDLSAWDGTFKGREVNNGVFVYVVEVEFVDGTTQTFTGDLTVVR
jgi:gliding motility-associated-like protein